MTTLQSNADVQPRNDRDALERSERKAAEKQPDNFKEQATDEKLVEIGPDLTDNPIKGIDPAEEAARRI